MSEPGFSPVKVLFLDVDFVLNCAESFDAVYNSNNVDSRCILQLKRVIDATGASIVMSSTWRTIPDAYHDIRRWLSWIDLTVHDATPDFEYKQSRGHEIQDWLDRHPEVTCYAIVDDYDESQFLDSQHPFFVRTGEAYGLTEREADMLINILNDGVPYDQLP